MCALRINEIKITTEKAEIILELKVIMNQIGTKIVLGGLDISAVSWSALLPLEIKICIYMFFEHYLIFGFFKTLAVGDRSKD